MYDEKVSGVIHVKQHPVVKNQASADLLPVSVCLDTERNYGSGPRKGSRHVLLDG